MSKTPSSGPPGEIEQVAKEDNLTANPATAMPTASADPKIVRKPEHRTRLAVRVAMERLMSVAISVTTSETISRPMGFAVVGGVALLVAGVLFWAQPEVTGVVGRTALWLLGIAVGGVVLFAGLRFIDKRHNDPR